MGKLLTFPGGGIHPPERKDMVEDKPIRLLDSPAEVTIPLSQHIGAPAQPVCAVGDSLKVGDKIGEAAGFVSSSIHSSLSGTVKEIKRVTLPNGVVSQAVVIERDDSSQLFESREREWEKLSVEELLNVVVEGGIVGMGGATFPAHVKFTLPKGKECEYFMVNGVECEPYLTTDHRLMLEKADGIVEGIKVVKKLINPQRTIIGMEENTISALPSLKKALKQAGLEEVEIVLLKVKYPQGAEKNLIKAITGREVPSGKLPLDVGVINSNVATLYALSEAVKLSKPLFERVVTVTGGGIANPDNLLVKVGTPFKELIEACGGFSGEVERVISGGPMMGFTLYDLETPVTKGTSGVLVLTKKEVKALKERGCISCGRCGQACPMGLSPTRLAKLIRNYEHEKAISEGLMDCFECGGCAFICPSHIPLVQAFRMGKRLHRIEQTKRSVANG